MKDFYDEWKKSLNGLEIDEKTENKDLEELKETKDSSNNEIIFQSSEINSNDNIEIINISKAEGGEKSKNIIVDEFEVNNGENNNENSNEDNDNKYNVVEDYYYNMNLQSTNPNIIFNSISEKKSKKSKNKIFTKVAIAVIISSLIGGIAGSVATSRFINSRELDFSNISDSNEYNTQNIVVNNSNIAPVTAIAKKVGPSVVGIKVTARVTNAWPFGQSILNPEGSGIIINKEGYIVTNNHVIKDALEARSNKMLDGSKIEVILPDLTDKTYEANVVARDERTDLAVLKIDARRLIPIEFADSDKIQVGELAVAIGNPGGLELMGSVTAGIISGLNRTIADAEGKELRLIQTDAAINPGNSGGALVDYEGKLIGINTIKIVGNNVEGLGFAIPSNKVKEIIDSLIEFKYVKGRPLFGITVDPYFTKDVAERYSVPEGALVREVQIFTGAYKAGVRVNDIITKFNGVRVYSVDDINEQKNKFKPGDIVDIEIYREDKYITLKVTLSEDKG